MRKSSSLKTFFSYTALSSLSLGGMASAQIVLIDTTHNNGDFESVTAKHFFTSPISGTADIPFWGATLVNTQGGTVGPPSDSGSEPGGNCVEQGLAGSFYQGGAASTAFNLVTTRPMKAGDVYTLTWYAMKTGPKGEQTVTLFSQSAANLGATYAYNPISTLIEAAGAEDPNFTLLGDSFKQYTLKYTATAADAGNLIGVTVGNSAGDYIVEDDFNLTVKAAP